MHINPNNLPKILAQYLVQCNKLQIAAENIRKTIASNPYFQVLSVFQRFDKFRKGYLEPADFSQFMLQNKVYPTETQLYLIFKDFDKQRKGIVRLQQFQDQLLPRQNRKLRKTVLQRHPYPIQLKLQIDLQFLLSKYFEDKINSIAILNKLRQKIKSIQSNAVQQAFKYLDSRRCGHISTEQQLDGFLRKYGKAMTKQQLYRIYSVINLNLNKQISFELFRQHLDPFYGGPYTGYKQKMFYKENLQKIYLTRKYQLQNLRVNNVLQRQNLDYTINQLRNSNRRLREIMDEQDYQNQYQYSQWRYRY